MSCRARPTWGGAQTGVPVDTAQAEADPGDSYHGAKYSLSPVQAAAVNKVKADIKGSFYKGVWNTNSFRVELKNPTLALAQALTESDNGWINFVTASFCTWLFGMSQQ